MGVINPPPLYKRIRKNVERDRVQKKERIFEDKFIGSIDLRLNTVFY